jgi:hypothetical protein
MGANAAMSTRRATRRRGISRSSRERTAPVDAWACLRRAPVFFGLTALPVLAWLLVLVPSALAESVGTISGRVTDAVTHAPIEGVEVCAFSTRIEVPEEEDASEGENEGCETTGPSGEYTITELLTGSYDIVFASSIGSLNNKLNYIAQYYNGKALPAEAEPVTVPEGGTRAGVNAELKQGGQITGTVTSASTKAPLEGLLVCALEQEGRVCAITGADGRYTISGLPNGSYEVEFCGGVNYATQFYNNKAPSEATTVPVSVKHVTTGIDAAMQPASPSSPVAEGSPPMLQSPVNAVSPVMRAPGVSPPLVLLRVKAINVRGGAALVELTCNGGTSCMGRLTLADAHLVGRRGKEVRRSIRIGTASFSIPAGTKATVRVRLRGVGSSLLTGERGSLSARLTIQQLVPAPARTELVSVHLFRQSPRRRPAAGRGLLSPANAAPPRPRVSHTSSVARPR